MELQILGWIAVGVLCLLGLAGNILPLLPGAPLLVAGFILGAWLDGFERVGWGWLGLLIGLGVVMQGVDVLSGAWGAKKMGASRSAIIGALLGAVLGIFLGLPGLILGPFVGAAVGEWLVRQDVMRAAGIGLATWVGLVVGMVLKMGLSVAMLGIFLFAYLY